VLVAGVGSTPVARDLAGRGMSVLLCEQHDLAAHTSSASTKLIHGGLRYLEHYEFSLVRKALAEREVLMRSAPHIMRPLRFVMPHDPSMRPVWMIRAGLFLYDHLARRELLPASSTVRLKHPAGARQTAFHQGIVLFRRLGRRRAPGGAECAGRAAPGRTVLTRCRREQRRRDGRWRQPTPGRLGDAVTRRRAAERHRA
jgi:glycerol-3-phosphate dehydrogenase